MKLKADLAALLLDARKNAFEKMQLSRNLDQGYGTVLALEQVRLALDRSRAFATAPYFQKDAVLDRALQTYSSHYLTTRRLGEQLGVKLRARIAQVGAPYFLTWDPGTASVDYTPFENRLHALLAKPGSSDQQTWTRFERLRRHVRPLYHELNHAVIFRLLEPSRELADAPDSPRKRQKIREYYAMVEALVIFRDILVAEEFGDLVWPFIHCGALYYGRTDGSKTPRLTGFDRFVCCVLHMQWQVLGRTSAEVRGLFNRADRKFLDHPYFVEFNDVTFELHRKWFVGYLRKYGASFRRPKPRAKAREIPENWKLRLTETSPEKLIRNDRELRKLYSWFRAVFLNQHLE